MSPLVEQLRAVSKDLGMPSHTLLDSTVVREVADRLEGMEAALEEVAHSTDSDAGEVRSIARRALAALQEPQP